MRGFRGIREGEPVARVGVDFWALEAGDAACSRARWLFGVGGRALDPGSVDLGRMSRGREGAVAGTVTGVVVLLGSGAATSGVTSI